MTAKEIALKALSSQDVIDVFSYCYCRYLDERKYEDVNKGGYGTKIHEYINKVLPCELIKATARPFGVIIKVDDVKVHIFVKSNGHFYFKQVA